MEEIRKDLAIECSPNTFRRLQNDEVYRDQFAKDVMESEGTDFIPNLLISEVPAAKNSDGMDALQESEIEEPLEASFSGTSSSSTIWLEAPTKLLLSLLEELRPRVGTTFHLKNKTKMWEQIREKLAEEGYFFSTIQVQGKFRSLERRYKQMKLHNSKTGRNRRTCPYESELERLLGERRGIHPDFILHSDASEGSSREELVSNAGSSNQVNAPTTRGHSNNRPAIRRPTASQCALERNYKRLDEIGKERAEYHSKVVKFLESSEAIEKKRNELLAGILEKLNN